MSSPTERPPLTPAQTAALAVMGAIYWLLAALIVRWTAASWVGGGIGTVLMFVAIVPPTVPALLLGYRIAGVGRDRALIGATIMTTTALLLDGVALTWFRSLYGSDPAIVLGGAASILWGAGVALVLGRVLQRG